MPVLSVEGLAKTFTLHLQGGVTHPGARRARFRGGGGRVRGAGRAVGRGQEHGAAADLRQLPGAGGPDPGPARGRGWSTWSAAAPRQVMAVRRQTLGYVSQFLRVMPRVSALDVVAEPLIARGTPREAARERAAAMLRPPAHSRAAMAAAAGHLLRRRAAAGQSGARLRARLSCAPARRADGGLDAANRAVVVELIAEAKAQGTALVAVCHDRDVAAAVATRTLDLEAAKAAA